jgi:hypothetical protein
LIDRIKGGKKELRGGEVDGREEFTGRKNLGQ